MARVAGSMLVVVVMVAVLLGGCTRDRGGPVGTWHNESLPETIEFRKDHTGTFVVLNKPSLPFRWAMKGPGAITVELTYDGSTHTLAGTFDKERLILEGRGQKAVYKKVD